MFKRSQGNEHLSTWVAAGVLKKTKLESINDYSI